MDKPTCPECGSVDIVKDGFKLVRSGPKQRYQCKVCRRKFVKPEADAGE